MKKYGIKRKTLYRPTPSKTGLPTMADHLSARFTRCPVWLTGDAFMLPWQHNRIDEINPIRMKMWPEYLNLYRTLHLGD